MVFTAVESLRTFTLLPLDEVYEDFAGAVAFGVDLYFLPEDGEPNLGLVPVVAPGLVDPDVPLGLELDVGDPNFGLAPVVEEGLVLRLGELKLGLLGVLVGDFALRLGELKLLLLPPLRGLADASRTTPPMNNRHTITLRIPRFIT